MSDKLYITRLWWDGHFNTGTAADKGQRAHISTCPQGLEHALVVDYAPVVDVRQISARTEFYVRHMTPPEIAAAQAYLDQLFGAAVPQAAPKEAA
jgi:hypothetical protein